MNIQNEVQKIHAKYGVIEKANYEIQKVCENYARIQIEKDRDRIKYLLTEHLSTHVSGNTPCCLNSINETPIILD